MLNQIGSYYNQTNYYLNGSERVQALNYLNNSIISNHYSDKLIISKQPAVFNFPVTNPNPTLLDILNGKVRQFIEFTYNKIKPSNIFDSLEKLVTTPYKDVNGNYIKLNSEAAFYFERLMNITKQKGITVKVSSSYRSESHQEKLFNNALKKYGSYNAARKWVAPPGHSQHNYGNAIDLSLYRNGRELSQKEFDAVISEAGFYRPMDYEGWHIEPVTTAGIRKEIAQKVDIQEHYA